MSSKACPFDNIYIEKFWSTMKEEIGHHFKYIRVYDKFVKLIDNYMNYYNNDRYQEVLGGLTPAEFYKYKMSGIYPNKQVLGINIDYLYSPKHYADLYPTI
jgi:transposase InsO family protein